VRKKKLRARFRAMSSSEEENLSIASLKRHPSPPRCLPANIAAAGGAASRVEVDSSVPSSLSRKSKLVVSELQVLFQLVLLSWNLETLQVNSIFFMLNLEPNF
jgi:hypothetical protein